MSSGRKGFLKIATNGVQLVGATATAPGEFDGPTAEITFNADWVHIVTDSYEGHALIDRASLPFLIQALQAIQDGEVESS